MQKTITVNKDYDNLDKLLNELKKSLLLNIQMNMIFGIIG